MSEVKLNWSTAEVKDGKLAVELEGEIPSGWKKRFETIVRLLAGGDWGKVQVKKGTVRVSKPRPGNEEKLRHYLESVVEQANAAARPADPESSHGDGQSDPDSPDARMTESFRAFGEDTLA